MRSSVQLLRKSIAIKYLLMLAAIFSGAAAAAERDEDIEIQGGIEVSVRRFSGDGHYLMLWLAPEYGFRESHREMARAFSNQGIEIWQANIIEALFLPQGTQSMRQLEGSHIADLLEVAFAKTGKKIVLVGDSYAASAALIGAYRWQTRKQANNYLLGAILFSPYAMSTIPPLGKPPEYLPIISASNIPILIIQAKNSGIYGQFPLLLEALKSHDSPIYVQLVPDVMSLFYVQPPTAAMTKQIKPLASRINGMIKLLQYHTLPKTVVPMPARKATSNGIDIALKSFGADFQPPEIQLPDINGRLVQKRSYVGKVTLVNFWATWCSPCIEEIPMLNRLAKKMRNRPFELISINYAEDKQAIYDFMEKVKIEFPVLLDHNGEFARRWKVISYPSTFVIAPDARIVYGVNAAIDWDSPDVLEKLEALYQ